MLNQIEADGIMEGFHGAKKSVFCLTLSWKCIAG
jgi:hypothetical protein